MPLRHWNVFKKHHLKVDKVFDSKILMQYVAEDLGQVFHGYL